MVGLAAGLAEGVGGLLFAAGLFFRPTCLAIAGVTLAATIEQFDRPMPAPEHANQEPLRRLGPVPPRSLT
jgi:hypothetical protein